MNVLITGGTGFIGHALCQKLLARGDQVSVLSRSPERVRERCGASVKGIGDLHELEDDAAFDVLVNLAGQPIADARWSEKRKRSLLQSRLQPTRQLIDWIKHANPRPSLLISASAVGYYGDMGNQTLDEHGAFHDEFAHRLCDQWEQAAKQAEALGVRTCIIRLGPVIGPNGGFLKKMLWPFKLGLGGKIGSGQQWFPWVHREDVLSALLFLMDQPQAQGVYNLTAPQPVSNQVFTETLARVLHRPALFPAPAWALKAAFGELSELLLGGQRAMPVHLQSSGFRFQFESLKPALQDVIQAH